MRQACHATRRHPDGYEDLVAKFRLHESYTFDELHQNACDYFNIPTAKAEEMELWCRELDLCWEGHLPVAAALRQLDDLESACALRPIPVIARINHQEAVALAAMRSREAQLKSRAEMASHRVHALKRVRAERRRSKAARSLIVRGSIHLTYTVMLIAVIILSANRDYQTSKSVRDAIAAQTFDVPSGFTDRPGDGIGESERGDPSLLRNASGRLDRKRCAPRVCATSARARNTARRESASRLRRAFGPSSGREHTTL